MSRAKLFLLGYPIVELIALWVVAQWIGWGSAIILLLLGIPVGFIIMGKASRKRPVWFLAGLMVS
ncbi:MAG: FxsA family protein, partial [Candidatus Nanopelagicales bacterium]